MHLPDDQSHVYEKKKQLQHHIYSLITTCRNYKINANIFIKKKTGHKKLAKHQATKYTNKQYRGELSPGVQTPLQYFSQRI